MTKRKKIEVEGKGSLKIPLGLAAEDQLGDESQTRTAGRSDLGSSPVMQLTREDEIDPKSCVQSSNSQGFSKPGRPISKRNERSSWGYKIKAE